MVRGGAAEAGPQPAQTGRDVLGAGGRSPTPRRWCGRSTSSSTPPSTARPSRSRRWSTNTPVNRCCIWWNVRSPPSGSSPSSRRCSPRPAGRRWCCGWTTVRSWFLKRCNGSATDKVGLSYIPPGYPWNNGYIESFNNRLRKECLNRNHWNTLFEARVVIGDFKDEHNHRHRHSALGYRTPAEYAARCSHTHTPWPARSTESEQNNLALKPGGLSIGDSPATSGRVSSAISGGSGSEKVVA